MTEFLSVLALYYLCEATALTHEMSTHERRMCFQTYETVKSHFIDDAGLAPSGTVERAQQLRAAYVAFQQWEDDNPDLVQEMRQEAEDTVMGVVPT